MIKKISIIILVVSSTVSFSCKKTQTCSCSSIVNGSDGPSSTKEIKGTSSQRSKECDEIAADFQKNIQNSGYSNYSYNCELK